MLNSCSTAKCDEVMCSVWEWTILQYIITILLNAATNNQQCWACSSPWYIKTSPKNLQLYKQWKSRRVVWNFYPREVLRVIRLFWLPEGPPLGFFSLQKTLRLFHCLSGFEVHKSKRMRHQTLPRDSLENGIFWFLKTNVWQCSIRTSVFFNPKSLPLGSIFERIKWNHRKEGRKDRRIYW